MPHPTDVSAGGRASPGRQADAGRLLAVFGGFALVLILGVVDYLTGFEFSFAVFYLLPVALVAWHGGPRWGAAAAAASAATWQYANRMAGETFSHPAAPYWNAGTRMGIFLVTTFLITRLRTALQHERDLARRDFLTGAANPRAFYERADVLLARCSRSGLPLTLVYCDADDFKVVNDRFGHHAGSELLVRVVEILQAQLGPEDTVARIGGDEFGILLPGAGAAHAEELVGRLRAELRDEMDRHGWPVTFGIGILTCAATPADVDEMIRHADALMYQSKRAGKDRVTHAVFDGSGGPAPLPAPVQ